MLREARPMSYFYRHPELVSGSMAGRLIPHCAGLEFRPWMLKQVQHDKKLKDQE
jgi:hypothetical protein